MQMETPSSTRRVTRSQTALNNAGNNNSVSISRKSEDYSEKSVSKSRTRNTKQQQEMSALIDITNDSPIVGVAIKTPSSAITKQRSSRVKNKTPGSGEALLRGQVKTLLQKVEEDAELSKLSLESRPFFHLKNFANSPMGLLAPTPVNTPQVSNLSDGFDLTTASPVLEEQLEISQVVNEIFEGKTQEGLESDKSLITRSLLFEFYEKTDISDLSECSSVLTDQGGVSAGYSGCKEKSTTDDDDASIWSIQVNTSIHDEDEEEEIGVVDDEEDDDYCEEDEETEGGFVDELCESLSKIGVKEKTTAEVTGKHTRFVYNSDDEIEEEQESEVLRLKGLPTPKGKHLRFPTEEDN